MFSGSRNELESSLVKALSRYIGYTAGAYDIDRIYSILQFFIDKPSAYEEEIVDFLNIHNSRPYTKKSEDKSAKYLAEVINFATSMQIIEIVTDRNVSIRRFAPTQLGRAVMGVQKINDENFYQFFRTKVTLFADADAIVPLLISAKHKTSSLNLYESYKDFQQNLRIRRLNWLKLAFPDRRLLERITERLPWVDGKTSNLNEILDITVNTARHHVTPRKEWLIELGLIDEWDRNLTEFGFHVKSALVPDNDYFWLGPPKGLQIALRVLPEYQKGGPFEDSLCFFEAKNEQPSDSAIEGLIEKTTEVMVEAYLGARLIYAPQASLQIPIEYINYCSYVDKIAYNWQDILDDLFRRKRSSLERFSARKGPVGFYKVKNKT